MTFLMKKENELGLSNHIFKHMIDKPSSFAHKEMSFFAAVMLKIFTKAERRLCISLRGQHGTIHQTHYRDLM